MSELAGKKITFVGAGSIADSLVKGMTQTGVASPSSIYVTNRSNTMRRQKMADTYHVQAADLQEALDGAHVIFLCMKPKDTAQAIQSLSEIGPRDALYISVIAGYSTSWLESALSAALNAGSVKVIRAMPNTSSSVQQSATGYCLGSNCKEEDARVVESLLRSVGKTYPVPEHLINAVTGLAGSGPAYIYYMVECMAQAGVAEGLDADLAQDLAIQTLIGAATMLSSGDESPAYLRERVTSPAGTTAAGLAALDEHGFPTALREAVRKASIRASELGK